jgi:hypothetical protein
MDKRNLMIGLDNILNNYVFGLTASRESRPEEWVRTSPLMALFEAPNGSLLGLTLQEFFKALTNPAAREIAIEEFENMLKRGLLTDTFELITGYSKDTNQDCSDNALFQFARIIRNTASHKTKGILGEWPKGLSKKGITELTWRNKTLSKERDVGKEVLLTHHEVVLMHWDMRQYAINNLN